MDQEPCFQVAKLCMSVWNSVDLRGVRGVRIVSITLICHCLEKIGRVKVYDTHSSDLRGGTE
jgi:hypothetical protein